MKTRRQTAEIALPAGDVPLPLEALAEHSAKPEGAIGPVALWGGRRRRLLDLPDATPQPKQDIGPSPLRGRLQAEPLFQADLQRLGIGSLVLGRSRIKENGRNSTKLALDSPGARRVLADR